MDLPRYRCHKEVEALKIANIHNDERADGVWWIITPSDEGCAPFSIKAADWTQKPALHIGGYYVIYKGGYTSFSPAKEFEDGYTKIWPRPTIAELDAILNKET